MTNLYQHELNVWSFQCEFVLGSPLAALGKLTGKEAQQDSVMAIHDWDDWDANQGTPSGHLSNN